MCDLCILFSTHSFLWNSLALEMTCNKDSVNDDCRTIGDINYPNMVQIGLKPVIEWNIDEN